MQVFRPLSFYFGWQVIEEAFGKFLEVEGCFTFSNKHSRTPSFSNKGREKRFTLCDYVDLVHEEGNGLI